METELEERKIAPRFIHRVNQLIKERIYFVKCENFVRFSRSASKPEWVLRNLQPHCPFEMTIIRSVHGGLKIQTELEKTFKRYQHNSLWFRYEGELKEWLEGKSL
jgi:hypothetical protein